MMPYRWSVCYFNNITADNSNDTPGIIRPIDVHVYELSQAGTKGTLKAWR